MRAFGFGLILALAGCGGDESVRAYGAADMTWVLTRIDGVEVPLRATFEFSESGRVSGQAPCNRWSATQTAPYPWFKLGPVAATRMACPDLQSEQQFFTALAEMTISEVSGDVLVLSNDAGREMVFQGQATE